MSYLIFQAINIGEAYQAVVPDLLTLTDLNDQGETNNRISSSYCLFECLEIPEDRLLWSPPLDTNQEENTALMNKYLKLAAKERM